MERFQHGMVDSGKIDAGDTPVENLSEKFDQ
jgi:hypothetical protein